MREGTVDAGRCPICRRNFHNAERIGSRDAYRISCQLCGEYDITGSALAVLGGGEHSDLMPYLTAHTRQAWELEGRRAALDTTWPHLAEPHRRTSVHQRFEKLLRAIERRTKEPGQPAPVTLDSDYPLVDSVSTNALMYFINHGREAGYLDGNPPSVSITVNGWDYLDPSSSGAGIPGRVFVAMRFSPALDSAYDFGLRAAIEDDCRMSAIRIDRVQHNDKICDKIIAEIRRCQFVVADFTEQNQGVYFEAGFAAGLGRTVIRTCRADEVAKLHFDTRQYSHVLWSTPEDLRERLTERIRALFPG